MKKLLSLTIALSLFVGTGAPAFATTSTIDPNSPRYQDGLTASLFRTQFDRAYNDINALWAYAVNLASTTASTISGDASGTASSGILPLTLNTVNSNVGSFGSASAVPTLTVNGKGLVTAAGSSAVVAPASTLSGTTLATGVTGSSLTSAAGGAFASGAYAAAYSLPTASTSVLGGVKVDGSTITIGSTGIISSTGSSLTNPTITGTATINPAINSPALTLSGNTDTASTNVLNITETWNNAATTFDAPIFENITNTASNTNSKVMDLWVNGSSVFGVGYNGTMATAGSLYIGGPAGMIISDNRATLALRNGGTVLSSPAGGVFQLGAADSASPIAQTLSAQSTVGGTTNTAGQNLTIAGSRGTGTGAGGSIVLQTAPAAGGSGSTQNALVTALTIDATSLISGIKETLSGLMTAQSFTATGTGADILPVGTTAQRPSSTAEGMLRDNTTSHQIEAFLNGTWSAVGSGGGGSPGGAVGSIQYNNSGAFGGLAIGTGISSYGGTLSTTSTALRTVYSTVDVISSTDGGVGVNYLSSSNTAVSIAAATTTGYGLGFATVLDNSGTGTVTLTPTTSTINY